MGPQLEGMVRAGGGGAIGMPATEAATATTTATDRQKYFPSGTVDGNGNQRHQSPPASKPSSAAADDPGFRFLGVHFAPLRLPLERRLQTAVVAFYVFLFLLSSLFCTAVTAVAVWFFPSLWLAVAAYAAWMYLDWDVGETGGREWELWARSWSIWSHMRDYFPIRAHRTVALPPSGSYLLAVHPHGVLSFGAFTTFISDALGVRTELLPGLETRLATLPIQFRLPFSREVAASFGAISASRTALKNRLRRFDKGDATVLVVGGASEALLYHEDQVELKLRHRKGFVRLALEHGKDLVPVFVFGEAFVYKQASNPEGSRLKAFQKWFQRKVSFSPPAFYGRGFFQYSFGFLPHRKPIDVVIGAPIPVAKVENPSQNDVDLLHKKYVDSLIELYDKYNPIYGREDIKLIIN